MNDSDDVDSDGYGRKTPFTWHAAVLMVLFVGAFAVFAHRFEKQEQAERDELKNEAILKTLPTAIAQCRALLKTVDTVSPVALAWHTRSLEWYVLEGSDNVSMRHFSCDGKQVKAGERYERVMLARVPVAMPGDKPNPGQPQNLFDLYADLEDVNVRALQAAYVPGSGALMERRWLVDGDVRTTRAGWEVAVFDFPVLLDQPPIDLATSLYGERKLIVPSDRK
jgi:hypothetical protein